MPETLNPWFGTCLFFRLLGAFGVEGGREWYSALGLDVEGSGACGEVVWG